jgi:HK97 family phage portal protein
MYPASNLKIRKLLRLAPNQMYSAYDLKVINVLDLMQTGNYFNRVYRKNGEINEIIRLDPSTVTVLKVKGKNAILYEVRSKDIAGVNKTQILQFDDIEHVKIMSSDGIIGRSPIMTCIDAFGFMLATQEYGSDFMANGAHLSGILSSDLPINETQQKQILSWWNDRTKAQRGGTAVLGSGYKYSRISATPVEADLINMLRLTDQQVNQIFRIPAHLNGDLSRSTNNNIEQQTRDFATHTLRPICKAIENEKNIKYWRTDENQARYHTEFIFEALLRADHAARAQFYNTMITLGVLTIDEVRGLEGYNFLPDGIGSKPRVQMNMVSLDIADQVATSNQSPSKNTPNASK